MPLRIKMIKVRLPAIPFQYADPHPQIYIHSIELTLPDIYKEKKRYNMVMSLLDKTLG